MIDKNGKKVSVVGAMCVSENVDILKITIPNLLKHSDWCLFLLDNETPEVKEYLLQIQRENYKKVWVRRSSIPHKVIGKDKEIFNYHNRWHAVRGIVRDEIFVNLRRILELKQEGFEDIGILIFPDSDECYNDCLPYLLQLFWESEYKAIAFRHVHPVNDLFTIKNDIMQPHVHIFKWQNDLSGLSRQWRNQMYPIKWEETMISHYYSIHLCYLTEKNRLWRKNNWKNTDISKDKLYKLDKSVIEIDPEDIKNIFDK
jgi:hypothetical protein